ncbi:LysM peptidoglycan-binding domain-containing protein [Lysobacter enzymogenes]|nr:LysM peptidoglycan-binding domain-containing protein [Lysobacter enzymogenes]
MVAIVTGNGLGLQASSALGLGGKGQVGTAGFGKSGEQVFVNAATGNLILRDRDQWLMGRGVDAELYRAYNSQAQLIGENWRAGVSKQVGGLTGTVNTAGSVVYRTDWDGSRIAYAWDAARSLYVAGDGAGTRDTLAWDAGNQRWTWTQGGSQLIERYDASNNGRVFESADRDGNATGYVYNAAGALGEVRTANGEITYLDYDGSGRLSKIRTVTNNGGGPQTSTAVRYGYDGAGRLSTVTLDLSPDDNSVADGKVFTTTYGYDGSSGRIASIAQSDGAKVAFGYQLIDGQYRVVSIAQTSDIGVLRTTTLAYDTANRRTTITDPLGQDTILSYDAQGRLLQTSSPAVNGTRQTQVFGYDAAGQVATIRDGLGNEVKYTYDAAGNLIKQEDAVGTVVERTFGSDNQLLSETVSGPNTAAATTRYVYDAEQHLRFKISAEGRVTEWRYNAEGQQIAMLSYSEGAYAGTVYSETALASWVGANARIGERTDSEYDFRGNLGKLTQYGTLAADGSGVIDDKTIQTRYVYDAQGRLLQRYAGPIAAPEVEQFVYDGLGRTIRTTGFNDAVTITQYDDAQRRTVVSFANGLVRTSSYNHAGELIALAESGSGGTVLSQVRYHYDADGRLRMTEDALGAKTHVLYDEAGRRVAEIDAAGALTEYVYDANNQVVKTLAYANAIDAAGLAALVDGEGKPKQTASVNGQTVALTLANSGLRPAADAAADRPQWRFYDAAGRLIKTVGGDGALTEYEYDAGSRLIRMQVHGAAVKMSAFLAAPTLANAVPERVIDSRSVTTRYFYSADGLLVGVQDGANGMNSGGGLTETIYDGAGRKIKTIGYATPTAQSLRMTGTLEQLRPGPNFKDIHNYYNYDSRGLLVSQIDGEGYLTRYEYDAAGNVSRRTRGEKISPTALGLPQTIQGSFTARVGANAGGTAPAIEVWVDGIKVKDIQLSTTDTVYTFNAQVVANANHQVSLVYRGAGAELWLSAAKFAGVAFDANGLSMWDAGGTGAQAGTATVRPAGEAHVTGDGAFRWAVSATQGLAALTATPGLIERTDYRYDVEGRLLFQTEFSSSGDVDSQRSYDSLGRVTTERRGDRKSHYRYDLQGRVVAQLSGEGVKALEALGANPSQASVDAVWADRAVRYQYDAGGRRTAMIDALDRSTLYYYDSLGRLTHTVNPLGEVSEQRYNAFGDVAQTIVYAKRLTSLSLGQMHGGALTQGARDAIAALDDAQASRTTLSYAITGALARSVDALGAYTEWTYTTSGTVEKVDRWSDYARTYANWIQTVRSYDGAGRQNTETVDTVGAAPLGLIDWQIRDAFGRVTNTQTSDNKGVVRHVASVAYDRNGRATMGFDRSYSLPSYMLSYDAFGNVLTRTEYTATGIGGNTTYAYTAFNREIQVATAEGVVTKSRYNEHGQIVELIDGRGNATVYEYDLDGRLIRTTSPAGTASTVYDQAGQAIETVDARGVKTVFEYDPAGRVLTRTLDPDGLAIKTAYAYDAKGQLVRTTDPNGSVTETGYDLRGQKVSVVVDAGEGRLNLTTTFAYDALGRTVRTTAGAGTSAAQTTEHQYDKAGRLIATIADPGGLALATRYAYDAGGNVVARTDANGHVTRYVYDRADQLLLTIGADGAVERRDYDTLSGAFVGITRFAKAIDLTGLGAAVTVEQILARLQPSAGEDRTLRQAFDRDGRLRYQIDALGYVTESVYDAGGNVVRSVAYAAPVALTGVATPASVAAALAAQPGALHAADRTTRAAYDGANRMAFQIDAGGYVTRIEYDNSGNVTARLRYSAIYPATGAVDMGALQAWAQAQPREGIAETHTVYDAAGRAVWQIDAGGGVTRNTFDAAGRLRMSAKFHTAATYPWYVPSAYTAEGMAAWYAQYIGIDARYSNRIAMWFYDGAGREVFNFDAGGYFTKRSYDGAGQLSESTRYERRWGMWGADREILLSDTPATLSALLAAEGATGQLQRYRYDAAGRMSDAVDAAGNVRHYERDGLGQVVGEYAAWGTAQQTQTRRRYDASGRMIEQIAAFGTAIAATSRYVYDAFGQAIASVDPRGVELAESDSQWALERRKALGYTNETGAALRAADLSPADREALLGAYTSTKAYDANGRVVLETDAEGWVQRRAYNAFGDAVEVSDKMGNVGYFFYDALGRAVIQLDPEGYVTRTEYDFLGNPAKVYRYANRADPAWWDARDTTVPPALPEGPVAVTQMEYDLLGRVTRTVDALGGSESYVYTSYGDVFMYTNKLGYTTQYVYDLLGRKTNETLPIYTTSRLEGRSMPVQNIYQYDAFGNLTVSNESVWSHEERAIYNSYDALNRKISSYQVVPSGQGDLIAQERLNYDARGNLVERIGPNNDRTVYYYDANDRLIGQVAPNGLLSVNEYDAAGNLVRSRAFTRPVALPAGWTLPALPVNPATGQADEAREIRYAYDRVGRKIEARTIGVVHGVLETYTNDAGESERRYAIDRRDIVETWSYWADGRLSAHVDGSGNITRTDYDALGRKILQVDGEGYAVSWDYDAEGNVLKEVRYARRQPPPEPTLAAVSAQASWTPDWPSSPDDRITVYTYDMMGRRLTESRLGVAHGTVDQNTGRLTEGFGTATTSYAYDAAGNLLRRTDANGSVFGWEYDAAGRNTALTLPGFVDYTGRSVVARTEYAYNGLNQVVREVRRGTGSEQDQVNSYAYGASGRLLSKTNALNFTTRFGYDAAGNMTSMSYQRTDSAGGQRTETVQVVYDESNRETSRVTVAGDGGRSVERRTRYNLFGDVTGRGTGPSGWQEYAEYDYAGRVLKSNMDGGVTRLNIYDGAGNAAVRIESQTIDLASAGWTLERVLGASAEESAQLATTLTLYDRRNQAVDVIQAAMTTAGERLGLKTVTVQPVRPGQIQASVGGRLGAQARTPALGSADGVPTIAPTNAQNLPELKGNDVWQGWPGGTNHNPPTAMLYRLDIPDYSAAFGGEYQIRVVLEGQQTGPHSGRWEDMDKPMPVYALSGQFVGDQASRAADMQIPVYLRNVQLDERIAWMDFTVKVFITPRGSGGGRELLVGTSDNVHAQIRWRDDWAHDGQVVIDEGSLQARVSGQLPPEFSGHVIQMPIDAYRSDISPQLYVRAKGSTGPYQALSVQRDFQQGKATVDVAALADGQYEVLYVASRSDGTLMRRERYDLTVGPSQSIVRVADSLDGSFQTNGLGTFVWTTNGLDMSNLLTRRSEAPSKVVVEYRRKGSQDAWTGTAALGGLPPMATPGSVRWDTTGLSGDYEVVLKMLDAQGATIESVAGEVSVGGAPRVALDFAHDADVVRLGNLPPNASSVDLKLLNDDGSVAWSAPGLAVANGQLTWPIPAEILAAAGGGVRRYRLALTFTDNLVVPPSSYTAAGAIEVGPQRQPAATIQVDGHLYTLNLDPQQPEGQVLVLHYRPEGDVNAPFQQVTILRGADGKFRWDSLGLNKEATYEYFYDVFRTLADAQNPAGGQSLVRNSGYFWADNDRPATEASWELRNFEPSSLTIHRRQDYNAFGEIAREIDGRGNATALAYNTLGKLVRKTDPTVWITHANGFREQVSPTVDYVYDLAGSVVAYRDANGNLTTQAWNYGSAQPTLVGEWHADGGVKRFQYDVFGNQRVVVDEIGRRTSYGYDLGNRLIWIERPKDANESGSIVDSYAYDELDRRIRHTSSLLGATTTDFTIEGEVGRVVSAGGRTTAYTATWDAQANNGNGAWRRVMTDANGRSTTDLVDALGRKLSHLDLGGHAFAYEYNYAGLLSKSGGTVYEYYANGLIKRMSDSASGIKGYYEYDENGNRTFEGFTGKDGNWAFQQSKGTYDALNRLIKVEDPRYEITYEFDAQGNRIRMHSLYRDGLNGATREQEYWYRYDTMNRFVVTMGRLGADNKTRGSSAADTGVSVWEGSGGDGVTIAYDAANQRRSARYARDGHLERYDYDARGYLTDTTIDGVLRARRVNDQAGRVGDYYEYDANGALKSSTTRYWDNDSLLMQEHDNQANTGTITYRLNDGTVDFTETYGEATTIKTSYDYVWFDGAKQTQIMVQASNQSVKNWAPGFSRYVYDEQGRIKLAYDQAGNRGFAYQVDGEGRILQRDELIGGQVDANGNVSNAQQNRHHSYYFFDDKQIGNVGNDGIDRIDYAKELAQNEARAGAKNDDRHKRFTPVAGANFDENYQPINSLYPTAAPGSYIVKAGDTLQGIAAALWGDSAMWYLLADANGLAPNQPLIANTVLTVPNKVTNIHNNASTFKPYDAGSAMGNTSPTVPEPPPPPSAKKGCGGFVKVLAIVVAVIVTIYTAGAAAGVMGLTTGASTTFGAGLAVLGGTATAASGFAAAAGVAAASFAAAAVGGAVGSIASQGVMIAGGLQQGFDWKGVGMSALGAGVTAGLGTSGALKSALDSVGKVAGGFGRAVASGAVDSAITSGLASALDIGSFSWKSVAISAASSGVGYAVGQGIGRLQYGGKADWEAALKDGTAQKAIGKKFARETISGFAGGVVSASARGKLDGSVLAQVGLDAVASTIGSSIAEHAEMKQAQRLAAANDERRNPFESLEDAALDRMFGGAIVSNDGGVGGRLDPFDPLRSRRSFNTGTDKLLAGKDAGIVYAARLARLMSGQRDYLVSADSGWFGAGAGRSVWLDDGEWSDVTKALKIADPGLSQTTSDGIILVVKAGTPRKTVDSLVTDALGRTITGDDLDALGQRLGMEDGKVPSTTYLDIGDLRDAAAARFAGLIYGDTRVVDAYTKEIRATASLSDLPKGVAGWGAAEAYGRSLLVARKNTADVTFSVRRELQVRGYQPKLEFASEALGELYSEIASSLISIPFGAALKAASARGAAVAEVPLDLPDEIDPLRQAIMQRLAEAVRYRAMGWNHEQGKFSIIETMAISRTERTFNKRFLPSNIEGVDVIDPAGWGNVSLKGPFLDKNLQPLASEFQMKAVGNISKHVANNTAVNTHVIDMTGLSDQAVKALQQSLQGSKVRIIYVKGDQ